MASIQNDLSRHDKAAISAKLAEMGMEYPYATLLVDGMMQQAPTTEYRLRKLERMDEDGFEEKFSKIMQYARIERRTKR